MYRYISRQIENRKSYSTVQKARRKSIWELQTHIFIIFLSKVFERIVFDQLYDYFTTNRLLFNSQCGFRKHHSTELAALELTQKNRREIDQKKTPFFVYLDLSKAFDTLNHAKLLKKPPILWLAGHRFILVQKLSFWPYPVRWIRRISFGQESYRNSCATRFNIGSFIMYYIYEWYTDCEWTSQLYFIGWLYDIDKHVMYVYTGSKSWCKPYVIFHQFRTL